jgi:hypothetical protein
MSAKIARQAAAIVRRDRGHIPVPLSKWKALKRTDMADTTPGLARFISG